MAGKKRRGGGAGKTGRPDDPEAFLKDVLARMEACPDAESLNDNVIMPFALALEKVALARGYILNIYGEASNVAVTGEDDAETIYHLIEEYLDRKD